MAQATQPFRQSLSGSVGAGMKSVFGGGGRRFYTLVHKVSGKYHQAGESQRIIVDEIVLGRDPSCQVRFDESFSTVSRRHAAIVKDGDNWKLVQLSQTNSTYLNGHKVQKEWYLQNGDEIQLSTNGPKLGFIIPEGKKGMVSSINLTARLNLFRQQALRPYKTALWSISAVFVVALCVGGYFLSSTVRENRKLDILVQQTIADAEAHKKQMMETIMDLTESNENLLKKLELSDKEVEEMRKRMDEMAEKISINTSNIDDEAINASLPYVFYVWVAEYRITYEDGSTKTIEPDLGRGGCSGTGFLLEDGRFVTARHVVEPWAYWCYNEQGVDEFQKELNELENNGAKVVAVYKAVSSSGEVLSFTSNQFTRDKSKDIYGNNEQDGSLWSLAPLGASGDGDTDFAYAYVETTCTSGLKYDSRRSRNLKRGESIVVLGFPMGLGVNAIDDINPMYATCVVAAPGLNNGVIISTDTNYETGNSGGPVFCRNSDNTLSVIGIVSSGTGNNTGCIVPISAIN